MVNNPYTMLISYRVMSSGDKTRLLVIPWMDYGKPKTHSIITFLTKSLHQSSLLGYSKKGVNIFTCPLCGAILQFSRVHVKCPKCPYLVCREQHGGLIGRIETASNELRIFVNDSESYISITDNMPLSIKNRSMRVLALSDYKIVCLDIQGESRSFNTESMTH
jgi:hypothetical protein